MGKEALLGAGAKLLHGLVLHVHLVYLHGALLAQDGQIQGSAAGGGIGRGGVGFELAGSHGHHGAGHEVEVCASPLGKPVVSRD